MLVSNRGTVTSPSCASLSVAFSWACAACPFPSACTGTGRPATGAARAASRSGRDESRAGRHRVHASPKAVYDQVILLPLAVTPCPTPSWCPALTHASRALAATSASTRVPHMPRPSPKVLYFQVISVSPTVRPCPTPGMGGALHTGRAWRSLCTTSPPTSSLLLLLLLPP